ncbi:MAG: aldo/keto reductase [Halobacteria archaeon]|nr:aldo/keto reductase [Halobacteria archaeon]
MQHVENQSDTFDIGGEMTVRRLGFGAMRITGENIIGEPDDPEQAQHVLRRAVDVGVDFIDTADSYGPGVSERLIRGALHPYDDVVIATKGGLMREPGGEWIRNGDPDYLTNAVLCSIDRLGVDKIDLYQLHRIEESVPLEDSLSALAELKDEGYIRHVGVSQVSVEELERARDVVEIATVQNKYNVTDTDDDDVLEVCEEEDIGFIPWFPLASGSLDEKQDVLEEVAEVQPHDATPYQIALAWLLERSEVMLPIPGTSSVSHLEENVAASSIELGDDEMKRLGTG